MNLRPLYHFKLSTHAFRFYFITINEFIAQCSFEFHFDVTARM